MKSLDATADKDSYSFYIDEKIKHMVRFYILLNIKVIMTR